MTHVTPQQRASRRHAVIWRGALLLVVTVGGGTNGIWSCLIWIASRHSSAHELVAVSALAALYGLGVWAGITWQFERARSRKLVRAFLMAQIPVLQTQILSFKFCTLASYTVIFHCKSLVLDAAWYLGADWEFSLFHSAPDAVIGLNLLPFAVMSLLRNPSVIPSRIPRVG